METLQKLAVGAWTVFSTMMGILVYIIIAVIVLTYIGIIPMGEPSADWYEGTQRDPFAT